MPGPQLSQIDPPTSGVTLACGAYHRGMPSTVVTASHANSGEASISTEMSCLRLFMRIFHCTNDLL